MSKMVDVLTYISILLIVVAGLLIGLFELVAGRFSIGIITIAVSIILTQTTDAALKKKKEEA